MLVLTVIKKKKNDLAFMVIFYVMTVTLLRLGFYKK